VFSYLQIVVVMLCNGMSLCSQGRQVLACAPTGSGKTVAFLIPIIHHLAGPRKLGFRAVIVSPTRELASQTYRLYRLYGRFSYLLLCSILLLFISHQIEKGNAEYSTWYLSLITPSLSVIIHMFFISSVSL
jgi:CRISPR/Cas system-associated endonuclease/helicase Cas3